MPVAIGMPVAVGMPVARLRVPVRSAISLHARACLVAELLPSTQQLGQDDRVVQGDAHPSARERVPHVHGVPSEEDALLAVLQLALYRRRQERVWHRLDLLPARVVRTVVPQRGEEGRDYRGREKRGDVFFEVEL